MSTSHARRARLPITVMLAILASAAWSGARAAALVVQGPERTPLDRPARLDVHDVPLGTALRTLADRSGVQLAYSPSLLPLQLRVSCPCRAATTRQALELLLRRTGYTARESVRNVMIVPADPAAARPLDPSAQPDAASPRLSLSVPAPAAARMRAPGTITGQVTAAETGEAIPAASVIIEGSQLGAITGEDGRYRIGGVPAGPQTVTVRRIGYVAASRPVTVPDGGALSVDFSLKTSAVNLQQIVVTGTAGNQTRAAQGAVVASVNVAALTSKAPVSSVTELLSGRVSGVNVTTASGTVGAAPRINIRGAASISLSNAPLVFIDGIRVSSESRTDVGTYHGLEQLGGQSVTALNDLNPDDIASIEIVKGPAAATLYGADASAGVIQIVTKKGRLGSHAFVQNASFEWNVVDPNFTPYSVFGTCSAGLVGPGGPALCQGLSAGSVVSDNPLVREGVYRNGHLESLVYDGHGGGDNFGYYVSASATDEKGTTPNNSYTRRTGRASFNWAVGRQLGIDFTAGLSRNVYKLPQGDDSQYGYLADGEFESSPFAVQLDANGNRTGGAAFPIVGLTQIRDELTTLRFTPSAQVHYAPVSWFTNRLTLGADLSSTHGVTFFPTSTENWYSGDQVNGYVEDVQNPIDIYTVDYLGDLRASIHGVQSDFSFGSQYIINTHNYLAGVGIGLATNSANLVSSASTNESHQTYAQTKSWGLIGQEQLAFGQRLFLQIGARIDQNSSFGQAYGAFFLPKASVSYVISQEPFWRRFAPVVSTLRLRAAYGTTGRSPTPGASLRTYAPAPYVTATGGVGPGVVQASPGNADLKPERGKEFEAGFDAGFFDERAGIELTYFDKRTSDLLLVNPLAPSLAYTVNPFVNAGAVDNRGLELTLRATPIAGPRATWDISFTGNTLRNRLTSLGSLAIPDQSWIFPDLTTRYVIGKPLSAWYSKKILAVDTAAGYATVTDGPVYYGSQFPSFQGNLSSTLTLFHNLRLYGLLSGQSGGRILNITQLIQDLVGTSAQVNLAPGQGGYSEAERLRHQGPFRTESGQPAGGVLAAYVQPTDFLRLSELSATLTLPEGFASAAHVRAASLTAGGRNLHLWKSADYQGWDPEVLANTTGTQFLTTEEFTVPQARRWIFRLNLQF